MSWQVFPKGISDLPHVLAGPIVKMTTANKVLVWLAVKQNCTGTLLVKDTGDSFFYTGDTVSPIKLGEYLYILPLTISIGASTSLASNTKYYYDVNFVIGGTTYTLGSPGILNNATDASGHPNTVGGLANITFKNGPSSYETLPSFMTPPVESNDLKFIHASCRKPHGNDGNRKNVDGLYGAYSILNNQFLNPSIQRPQQLFLTGDQIYADDIAGELLFYISNASNALMGSSWVEPFSASLTSTLDSAAWVNCFDPGNRANLNQLSGFTSDADSCSNQLVYLKEFFCAYLFFWSDALWPANTTASLPDFNTIYPNAASSFSPHDLALLQSLQNEEHTGITDFLYELPYARKVLANMATYMVFDDHEITDDLFLNLDWSFRILGYQNNDAIKTYLTKYFPSLNINGLELGQRILSNGLTAINMFQYLGNYDSLPVNSDFIAFTSNLASVVLSPSTLSNWTGLQGTLLPVITPSSPSTNCDAELVTKSYWNFSLLFGSYQVIFLNSRTQRGFLLGDMGKMPVQIIAWNKVNSQLQALTSSAAQTLDFTIIVAQTPVMGYIPVEESIKTTHEMNAKTVEFLDYEDWGYNDKHREYFLQVISQVKRVIFISGDVHYSFANKIKYWNNRNGFSQTQESRSTFIQLTSSSLKNEATARGAIPYISPKTTQLGTISAVDLFKNGGNKYEFVGWANDGNEYISIAEGSSLMPLPLNSSDLKPAFTQYTQDMFLNNKTDVDYAPSWSYRVESVGDIRDNSVRASDGSSTSILTVANEITPELSGDINLVLASASQRRHQIFDSRYVVGNNNVALVSFSGFPTSPQVTQTYYFSPATDYNINASNNNGTNFLGGFTTHVIAFDLESYVPITQTTDNPKPGYDD